MRYKFWLLASLALAGAPIHSAFAQDTAKNETPSDADNSKSSDDYHNDEIVVTAPLGKRLDILSGTSSLAGESLASKSTGQIGDTLTDLPGVSATSFSPGASRPVLRGFQGGRVAVLTDGIGNIDASNTSADHAVTIESLTAERIEVLRGPAVLLFGGQAVGGAVNIIDKRIPRSIPHDPVHIDALTGYASANREYSASGSVDFILTERLVGHVDGSYRHGINQSTGGLIFAPALQVETFALADQADNAGNPAEAARLRGLANARGRVAGTQVETWTAGTGIAFIDDGGNLGVSFNIFDSKYGIPSRPGGEENVTISLRQYRFDLRGEVELGDGLFETLKVRTGYANYTHQERAEGETGTLFLSKGIETRLELSQNERGNWQGASGIQYQTRDFAAIGEEAFVPPNLSNQIGFFTLQEFGFGDFGIEAALRFDHSGFNVQTLNLSRSFNNISAALGLSYSAGNLKVGANVSRTGRAPSAEELFSDGAHIATQAFEVGDPDLTSERSWNGEAFIRYESGPLELSATVYINSFDNFIFERETGAIEDNLPVFQIVQRDARFYGAELEATGRLGHIAGFDVKADLVADFVRAKLAGNGGNIPRIPPLRLKGGLALKSSNLDIRGEVEWADDQNKVASFETPTAGYTVVNASAIWRPWGKLRNISLILGANNIFDVSVRRAASFTKDFAPLAGRDFRLTARFSF